MIRFELPTYQGRDWVIFLDQSSTRIGFAELSPCGLMVGSIKPQGKNIFHRMDDFIAIIEELLSNDPDICFYEGGTTMGGLRGKAQKRIANVMEYEIERLCFTRGIKPDTIHNQTLKKNIIELSQIEQKNDQSKAPVRTAVIAILGSVAECLDEDAIDATAMALLYAHGMHRPLKPKTTPVKRKPKERPIHDESKEPHYKRRVRRPRPEN